VFGRIGDAQKARENLERAVALARDSDESETVLALQALGNDLEHGEGDYQGAGERYGEALALAERIGEIPAQIELHAGLGQLALQRGDWTEVERRADLSAGLAEREGLIGKLCLANVLRGSLHQHQGDHDAARRLFTSAHEQAVQLGWSEVSCSALLGMAGTLEEAGELSKAGTVLREALETCDRAGLLPQSVRVNAALAAVCIRAGELEAGREAALRAVRESERVKDPVARAAAQQAAALAGPVAGAGENVG
jgi:tetratricopeptide (TPR) repeat protein